MFNFAIWSLFDSEILETADIPLCQVNFDSEELNLDSEQLNLGSEALNLEDITI